MPLGLRYPILGPTQRWTGVGSRRRGAGGPHSMGHEAAQPPGTHGHFEGDGLLQALGEPAAAQPTAWISLTLTTEATSCASVCKTPTGVPVE